MLLSFYEVRRSAVELLDQIIVRVLDRLTTCIAMVEEIAVT